MQPNSLSLIIRSLKKSEKPLFISQDINISSSSLIQECESFRLKFNHLKHSRCLINSQDDISLAKHLVFLDGFVQSMIILPLSLSDERLHKDVINTNEIDYTINIHSNKVEIEGNILSPINKENHIEIATNWTLLTSGTSGKPKALVHNFETLTKKISISKKSISLVWGLAYGLERFAGLQVFFQAILNNQSLVIPKRDITFSEQISLFIRCKVDALSATPSYWRKLLMDQNSSRFNFNQITLGGEISDQSILSSLAKTFKSSNIYHIYASTEAGAVLCIKDKLEGFPLSLIDKMDSLKIINNELYIKSESKAKSYLDGSTLELDKQGFYPSGDVLRIDIENDRVKFVGRKTGTINVGGNKVIPEEVETIINQLDFTQHSLVTGMKNSILGSLVCAQVQLTENTVHSKIDLKKMITQHCKKNLEDFKVPVIIKFVDMIKINDNGKVLRESYEE